MSYLDEVFGLQGRVALVTGASSGLGADAAEALGRAGAAVALVARRKQRLEEQASVLAALGVRVLAIEADITVDADVERAVEEVARTLGPIDILLNAAGLSRLGRAERHRRQSWDEVIAVNLTAAFRISQAVGLRMIAAGKGGRIIHISSVMGRGANPVHRTVGYAASKAGVDNLTRQLAVEWAQHGITVNAIAPAYFPTEMTMDPKLGEIAADQLEELKRVTPMGRVGAMGELRSAVLFLAAPASSYVTGSIVAVDGGWTAW